jgi:hypothetical protein
VAPEYRGGRIGRIADGSEQSSGSELQLGLISSRDRVVAAVLWALAATQALAARVSILNR